MTQGSTSKAKLVTVLDLLFLFLLAVSGSFEDELASELVYYLAFLIPTAIGGYFILKNEAADAGRENIGKGDIKYVFKDLGLTRDGLLNTLPVIVPQIAVVCLVSYLTSLLMGLFGKENAVTFNEPLYLAMIIHALVPAILEELLFRFVPIRLFKGEGKTAVLLSSLMFAFAHASLFQIPYAFIAGVIFSALYIATGSILIPILLHFLNNAFSLLTIYEVGEGWLIPIGIALLAVSSIALIIRRKTYAALAKKVFSGEKIKLSPYILIFIGVSLFLAISSIFA